MEGTLERAGLTQALHGFRSGRRSGVLHLAQNGATRRVYFKDGEIVFASSDVGTERLGEVLVASGRLKRSELELACKVREMSPLRLGKTLVELGYFTESELDAVLKSQVETVLKSLLPGERGSCRAELRDDPLATNDHDLLRADISTENVLLEVVRQLDDAEAIRAAIGDLTHKLRFAADPGWVGANLSLTPSEGFVLSRVDGSSSAAEIAKLSPMGEDETLRCICALLISGVLNLEPRPASTSSPARPILEVPEAPETPVAPSIPAPPVEARQAATPPLPTPPTFGAAAPVSAPESIPDEEPMSPEARQFHEEMLRRHAAAHEATYYELLDIRAAATPEEIKAGYFRLAKRLHPDHRAGLKIHDPEGVFDDLYLAVKAAYEILSSETERRRYDFSLEEAGRLTQPVVPAEPPPSPRTSPDPKPPPPPRAPPTRTYDASQMARLHFANGHRYFNEARYHEAVEELQDAVRLDAGRTEYRRLLGYALAKNPKWRRRAEAHFLKVLETNQFDIDTMLGLAEIYEAGGMEQRARKVYEEALGLDPGNERALAKLNGDVSDSAFSKLKGMLHRSKGH